MEMLDDCDTQRSYVNRRNMSASKEREKTCHIFRLLYYTHNKVQYYAVLYCYMIHDR